MTLAALQQQIVAWCLLLFRSLRPRHQRPQEEPREQTKSHRVTHFCSPQFQENWIHAERH